MSTHSYRLLSSFSGAAIKFVAKREEKKREKRRKRKKETNKQRIIHGEKFYLNDFIFSMKQSRLFPELFLSQFVFHLQSFFDQHLHFSHKLTENERKINQMNGMKEKSPNNTIELMNGKCEFNQAFQLTMFFF